jgi:hypothetical protein
MSIINKIIKNKETKSKEIQKLLDPKKKFTIDFNKNRKDPKTQIKILDNKKLLLIGDYHFFGIYQTTTKLWIWASSIPGVSVSEIKYISKLKKFNHLFENNNSDKINFYYQLLTQDTVYIDNNQQLEWIIDLILYLSDDIWCFTPMIDTNIQFITISKINEKYI